MTWKAFVLSLPILGKLFSIRAFRRTLKLSLFDESWYLDQNKDVALKGANPLKHYRKFGWREGRWPNPIFDPVWYVQNNPDVAQPDIDPLKHFEDHGRLEGRRPSALFDPALYLLLNPDIALEKFEPCEHYLRHGRLEGRPISVAKESHTSLRDPPIATAVTGVDDFSNIISPMRDPTTPSDRRLVETAVERGARVLMHLDANGIEWRARLLAKAIYRVDESRRPVADGLSYAYLELADALNDGGLNSGNITYEARIAQAGSDPVGAIEALMQRELGRAIMVERELLKQSGARRQG